MPLVSLLDLCVRLVAGHLDAVESLVGFPELVARQIVDHAVSTGLFNIVNDRCLQALRLVNSAYPGQPLSSVCIRGPLQYAEWEPALEVVVQDLTALQISNCCLTTARHLMQTMSTCTRLRILELRYCGLDDALVQKLTLRGRCYGVCLQQLELLDLRFNRLTAVSALRLARLRPACVALSAQLSSGDLARLSALGYVPVSGVPATVEEVRCQGWLADTALMHWVPNSSSNSDVARKPTPAAKFYGRPARTSPYVRGDSEKSPFPPSVFLQLTAD